MDIIPAIDIKNGKVVKALSGKREFYTPICKHYNKSSNPLIFINGLIKKYKPSIIYIADIDSIAGDKNNFNIIELISKKYPNLNIWLDSGNVYNVSYKRKNINPILCSEKCNRIININYKYKEHIHSYDYTKNLVGESNFKSLASKYKNKIIIMDISAVGTNSGPDFKMIKCEKKSKGKQYYVAGGVRSLLDIYKLRNIGIDGVLISSLLFKNQTNSFLIKKRAGT